jgi:hypothetical protein
MQQIVETLDRLNSEFMVVRFRERQGYPLTYGVCPPIFYGGTIPQRLAVMEAWYAEIDALTEEQKKLIVNVKTWGRSEPVPVEQITRGIDVLLTLRALAKEHLG